MRQHIPHRVLRRRHPLRCVRRQGRSPGPQRRRIGIFVRGEACIGREYPADPCREQAQGVPHGQGYGPSAAVRQELFLRTLSGGTSCDIRPRIGVILTPLHRYPVSGGPSLRCPRIRAGVSSILLPPVLRKPWRCLRPSCRFSPWRGG